MEVNTGLLAQWHENIVRGNFFGSAMQGTAKVHVYVQCILAFVSQSEKIYWNMHSKVPRQLEAK